MPRQLGGRARPLKATTLLSELSELAISNAADGDLLVYNSDTGLWENGTTLQSITLQGSLTGVDATFSGDVSAGSLTTSGALQAGSSSLSALNVSGNSVLTGDVTISGALTLAALALSGALSAASLTISGATTLAATSATSLTVTGDTDLAGVVTEDLHSTGNIIVDGSLTAGSFSASTLAATDTLTVNGVTFQTVNANGINQIQYNDPSNSWVLGRDQWLVAQNTSGAQIDAGTPVYLVSSEGTVPTIAKADPDDPATGHVLGVTREDIADDGYGPVVVYGYVTGIDTSAYSAGDLLWLSATAGTFSTTAPQGSEQIIVASVIASDASAGILLVAPLREDSDNIAELEALNTTGLAVRKSTAVDYESLVLSDEPTVYFRMDEASGQLDNIGSTGATGDTDNVTNATYQQTSLIGDAADYAMSWAGTGYAYTGSATSIATIGDDMTIECWFSTTSSSGGVLGELYFSSLSSRRALNVYVNTDGTLRIRAYGTTMFTSSGSYNDGDPHHVVATLSGGTTGTLWVDGVELGSGTPGTPDASPQGCRLEFAATQTVSNFTGTIDEIATYDKVLGDSAIAAHYAAGIGGGGAVSWLTRTLALSDALSFITLANADGTAGDPTLTVDYSADITWTGDHAFEDADVRFVDASAESGLIYKDDDGQFTVRNEEAGGNLLLQVTATGPEVRDSVSITDATISIVGSSFPVLEVTRGNGAEAGNAGTIRIIDTDGEIGDLIKQGSGTLDILNRELSAAVRIRGTDSGSSLISVFEGLPDGAATMLYAGTEKLATTSTGAELVSSGPVVLSLEADTDNSTESDTAVIRFQQDGGGVECVMGTTGAGGVDPLGNTVTNAGADSFMINYRHTKNLELVTNDKRAFTLDSSQRAKFFGFINVGQVAALTIASGVVTPTQTYHRVDTESSASSDDLDTITATTEGDILILRALNNARTVVVKDGTGNLQLAGDFSLDHTFDKIMLMNQGANWVEMFRSNNQ